jgi:hypothetical protein
VTETTPTQTENLLNPPIVDPSPTQAPIQLNPATLADELARYPAPASPQWVLGLEPNSLGREGAVIGPDAQIDPNVYVHMTKPDGSEFLAPLSNADYYERKGFTRGAEEEIPDLVVYQANRAKQAPASTP